MANADGVRVVEHLHTEAIMIRTAFSILRWSTIRWIEIFFVIGLPLALTAGVR
ncbi:MAG: hypothetical protein P8Z36_06655 [Gemmatimonadota bacterium]|jgi:hypothetical protein